MTRAELIAARAKGRMAFRAEDFSGQDLSGINLSGCDLRRSNFTNANLSGCNLENAIMVVCNVSGAVFDGALIDGVDWELVQGTPNLVGAIYDGDQIKEMPIVDKLGKYQRLVTDRFIQIGCLKGNEEYWKTMDDAKLAAEVDKVNPEEKLDAKAWKDSHLGKTIQDHDDLKEKK